MKKRIFALALAVLMAVSLLCLGVMAKKMEVVTLKDDLKEAYYQGNTYVRINASVITEFNGLSEGLHFELSDGQSADIINVSGERYGDILVINLEYTLGGFSTFYYHRESTLDAYNAFINGGGEVYIFDMSVFYPFIPTDTREVAAKDVFVNKLEIPGHKVEYYSEVCKVTAQSDDGVYSITTGYLLNDDGGSYYYLDVRQFGATRAEDFNPHDHDTVVIWDVTEAEWLKEAIGDEDDIEFPLGGSVDSFIGTLSIIVFAFGLGVVPLVGMILCLTLTAKAANPYKRYIRIVALLLGIELLAFCAIIIMLIIV
ncbi:MAG: hypothetical protein IKA62_08880 [Clostridia bacterium]|nr:hypothetical protein [Clostridia bacterium]MBR2370973.1 hypothetical protein [Clostridia bacterium]